MQDKRIKAYRGYVIYKDMTGRYDVRLGGEADYVIADSFISIGEAMTWIDSTQFDSTQFD